MPYNFTSLSADDITFSLTTTMVADNRAQFVCGWWRPTGAVTATQRLWSLPTNTGLSVGAGDTLLLRTNNATTIGEWTAASTGLVVDEWRFVAYLGSTENTGVLNAVRIWTGSIGTAPEARTVTNNITPVGNFTGSATFYIGNLGTAGALSFGGQIADVSVIATDAGYGVTTHPFGLATSGVITDAEALHVYETLVLPLWLGKTSVLWQYRNASAVSAYHISLNSGDRVVGNTRGSATVMPSPAVTINGATWSQEGAPRPRLTPAMWPDLVM
jgi:hypothetical protein